MSLVLTDIALAYPDQPPLFERFNLTVEAGAITTVMGPSGSGKSTLLAALAGQLPGGARLSGQIHLAGREISGLPPERRGMGTLFQDSALFPHLDVAGNLAFGLRLRGREARQSAVAEALTQAGLAGFERRDPASLSGGQAARVLMMRLLLSQPKALLLDEPFSKLDQARREDIRGFVFAAARRAGLPTLLVTHDAADAEAAGGAVVRLAHQPH